MIQPRTYTILNYWYIFHILVFQIFNKMKNVILLRFFLSFSDKNSATTLTIEYSFSGGKDFTDGT